METIESAQFKDSILNYLNNRSKQHIPSEVIYNELKLEPLIKPVFNEYLREIARDGFIQSNETSGDRTILMITDAGRKLLFEGGYVKRLEMELTIRNQKQIDDQKDREKTDLEIRDLKHRIDQYVVDKRKDKRDLTITIAGLIISVIINILQFIL